MSKIIATVKSIDNVDSLNIVKFDFFGNSLTMMSLDLSSDIQKDAKVELSIKPSSIAIAKKFSGEISYSNQLKAKIVDINNGKLLTSIRLSVGDIIIESIITLNSSIKMNLKIDDEVTALVKASEVSIKEVL